MTLSKTTLCI
jgi:hypothetical protein